MMPKFAVPGCSSKNSASVSWLIFSCVVAAIAYLPALNNGFIADDWVILERVDALKTDPLSLYQVPPENFRLVSYLIFAVLKAFFGYHASFFYAFNIVLHIVNVALLWRLLELVTSDHFVALLGTLFFAAFQAPQEAVMWLAAMNETTLGFFALMTALMWCRERHAAATLFYTFALFSKESAPIILVIVFLMQWYQKRRLFCRAYLFLLIPTAGFTAIFLSTLTHNFMITNHSYAFGPQAFLVLTKTLHRLIWPWLYIILLLVRLKRRVLPPAATVTIYLACVVVPMLPYMFIAYQTSLPSRQLYLSSAVLMPVFAVLLKPLQRTTLLNVFVIAFVGFNVGYLWIRKDRQFEERAAPTTQLVNTLRLRAPQRTIVLNFAYPYPAIARAAAWALPGWRPQLILVGEPAEPCSDCWRLRWDAQQQRYD